MLRHLARFYRIIATGFSFLLLFGGGTLLALLAFPVIHLYTWTAVLRRRRNQYVIHVIFKIYIGMLQFLGLLRLEVTGRDLLKADQGVMVIANHPSLLDVVILMSIVENAQCVVKSALWHSFALGLVVRGAGYIRNDLPSDEMVAICQECFSKGENLIIFPEGTRTTPGQKINMRRGFANIAIYLSSPIRLVTIKCTPPTLLKGERWWEVPSVKPVFRVVVGDLVNPKDFSQNEQRSLAVRKLVRHVEGYYDERLTSLR